MAKSREKKTSKSKVHEKKTSSNKVHKKKDGRVSRENRAPKQKSNDSKNNHKAKVKTSLLPPQRISEDSRDEVKGSNPEFSEEFPSIEEGISQEAKSKSLKKEKQAIKRRKRGAELADKAQQKLGKKAMKAASVTNSEPKAKLKTKIYGLTPPKTIQALTIAASPVSDNVPGQDVLLVDDRQLLSTSNNKEHKRLRRLKRVEEREDKSVVISRPKSLEKLASLINRRDGKYSGAKFAALLDLAEKILVVEAIPGETIEQKANKIAKDIADEEVEMERLQPEAEGSTALVLRAETPENLPDTPSRPLQTDSQARLPSGRAVHCRWKKCEKKFNALKDLFSHVCQNHTVGIKDGVTQRCRWNHCKIVLTKLTKQQHMINHIHDDFCDWTSDDPGTLRDHAEKSHLGQLTSVPDNSFIVKNTGKRSRNQNDDDAVQEVTLRPCKKRKLVADAGPALGEPTKPKTKKRKHEKESTPENLEDQIDSRPKKKIKKSHKH